MSTDAPAFWEVAARPKGEPPEVGRAYRISHGRSGPFRGRVLAIEGDKAVIEVLSGIATFYFAEDCRGPGQRVTVEACHCFFKPERDEPIRTNHKDTKTQS